MRKNTTLACLLLLGILATGATVTPKEPSKASSAKPATEGSHGIQLETLMHARLERVEGTEVIVSRVSIPPHSQLPKHWHPGEEFAYVLEGSVTLWQKGKEDIVGKAGDVVKVPLKQVHTAITTDEGATILVFRVHEEGQPERFPVE